LARAFFSFAVRDRARKRRRIEVVSCCDASARYRVREGKRAYEVEERKKPMLQLARKIRLRWKRKRAEQEWSSSKFRSDLS
jgi:hypothetical protein